MKVIELIKNRYTEQHTDTLERIAELERVNAPQDVLKQEKSKLSFTLYEQTDQSYLESLLIRWELITYSYFYTGKWMTSSKVLKMYLDDDEDTIIVFIPEIRSLLQYNNDDLVKED